MFKKPNKKSAEMVAKGFASFTGGRMLSRGIVGIIPAGTLSPTMSRGLVGGLALLAAAAYTGSNKELVVPAFVGAASEQLGTLIDREARKLVPSNAHPALQNIVGRESLTSLGCPGNYPALSQPFAIEADAGGYMQLPERTQDFAGA